MSLASRAVQRVLKLDPPLTRDVVVQPDLRVPMPDGEPERPSAIVLPVR
jgi:uncharacterized protein